MSSHARLSNSRTSSGSGNISVNTSTGAGSVAGNGSSMINVSGANIVGNAIGHGSMVTGFCGTTGYMASMPVVPVVPWDLRPAAHAGHSFTSTTYPGIVSANSMVGSFQQSGGGMSVSVSDSEISINGKRYKRSAQQQGDVSIINGNIFIGGKPFVPDQEAASQPPPILTYEKTFDALWPQAPGDGQELDFTITHATSVKILAATDGKASVHLLMRSRHADMDKEGEYFRVSPTELAISPCETDEAHVTLRLAPTTHGRVSIMSSGEITVRDVDAPFMRVLCKMEGQFMGGVGDVSVRGSKLLGFSCVSQISDITVTDSNLGMDDVVRVENMHGCISVQCSKFKQCIASTATGDVYVDCCPTTTGLKVTTTSGSVRVMGAPRGWLTSRSTPRAGTLPGAANPSPRPGRRAGRSGMS